MRHPVASGRAIARVLDDPALARALVERGLAEARERWTWKRTAERYDALLEGLARWGPR